MAAMLAARYAALLNNWDGEPNPVFEEKVRLLRGLNRDLAMLQKTLIQSNRQKREQEKAQDEEDRLELEMEKERVLAPIRAKAESDAIAAAYGGGEQGRMIGELLSRVKHNLPAPQGWEEQLKRVRKENAQRARQSKSERAPEEKTGDAQPANQTESNLAEGPSAMENISAEDDGGRNL